MGNERIYLSTGQFLSILFYLLESPARLFRPLHLANGRLFSLLDLLALGIPSKYLDPLLRLLDVCIKKQEPNLDEMREMLGAALNCAILHDCKQLVQYLLDKLCQTGAQTLRAGRSPFPLASVFEGDVSKPNHLLPAAVRSSLEKSESACNMPALVVACLAGSIDSIEMLHACQITFDFYQVSYYISYLCPYFDFLNCLELFVLFFHTSSYLPNT